MTARQFNESSALVQWQPPLADQRNGIISAYQVRIDNQCAEDWFRVALFCAFRPACHSIVQAKRTIVRQ